MELEGQTPATDKPKRIRKPRQTQAAAPKTEAPAKPKRDRRKQPGAEASQKQGAGDAGKLPGKKGATQQPAEVRGGTAQVLIEVVAVGPRGGRPEQPEQYPFGSLEPAKKTGADIVGPSFFIPDADNPDAKLASARKRHKKRGYQFWSRMETKDGVKGKRFWRAAPGTA